MENETKIVDVNIGRRNDFTSEHCRSISQDYIDIPLFSIFEINSSGLCNRTCSFCPRGDPEVFPNVKEFLSLENFEKILKELKEVAYDGIFLISAFSEPLLHKKLEDMLRLAKQYCPNSRIEMVTNGDCLTLKRLKSVFEAGLDTMLISMYDGPEQITKFENLGKEAGIDPSRMVLRKRFSLDDFNLANRGGLVSEDIVAPVDSPLKKKCYLPSYTILMDYDGEVYICTHDWGRKLSCGNAFKENIIDIWKGEKMNAVRRNLLKGVRDVDPCDGCNVEGTLVGDKHAVAWSKYYEKESK